MNDQQSPPKTVDWRAVGLFYLIACGVSWPLFWLRDMTPDFERWLFPRAVLLMWGPGIAALICLRLFRGRHVRRVTLFGTSRRHALAFYVLPLLLLSALGGKSWDGWPPHLVGIGMMGIALLTVMGEELGWRGFLQDALRPLPRLPRYALIGIMWEFWHFTNRTTNRPLLNVALTLLVWYPALIALSWIIGEAVERSRSLLVAHSLHVWLNIPFEVGSWQCFAVLAVSLGLWAFLLVRWPAVPLVVPNEARARPAVARAP